MYHKNSSRTCYEMTQAVNQTEFKSILNELYEIDENSTKFAVRKQVNPMFLSI